MSFKLLKQVITHLKKTAKCPRCSSLFDDDSIFVLATSSTGTDSACNSLLAVVCPNCTSQAFIMIEVTNITTRLKKDFIRIHTKTAPRGNGGNISDDDILDMHNFLRSWQGDLTELFK